MNRKGENKMNSNNSNNTAEILKKAKFASLEMRLALNEIEQEEIAELLKDHRNAVREYIEAFNVAIVALSSVREIEQELEALGVKVEKLEEQQGLEF
jgi:hypothetical protein